MAIRVDLYLTPAPFLGADLQGKLAVVVDVLRCTTSVCAALMAGAKGVIPVTGPGKAVELATKLGRDTTVLAGERSGIKPENFQLGNSPAEFTPDIVGNKMVVMSTTNGSPLFVHAAQADLAVAGAFVNITRVVDRIVREEQDIIIACSGREGDFSVEDTICGGMLIDLMKRRTSLPLTLNDASSLAHLLYRDNSEEVEQAVRRSEHGRFLSGLGFDKDITDAAAVDSMPVLPLLAEGCLVAAKE